MVTIPGPSESIVTRRRVLAALGVAAVGAAGLGACTTKPGGKGTSSSGTGGKQEVPQGKAKVAITTPGPDAKDVAAGVEIVFTATDAVSTTVSLKDSAGADVPGAMHPDGTGWLPKSALDYGKAYTATVAGTDSDGKVTTATSGFTTMAKPSQVVSFVSFLGDDAVVGVGMPLIFKLSRSIDKSKRAAAQRRLLVTTEPAQEGSWNWYSDTELHWRPKQFWQAGTKISVNVRIGGLALGNGYYGKQDSTLRCTVGPSVVMTVDDTASPKVLHVIKDGVTIRTIPVSLGRPTMPSSSGTTVVIEKLADTVFDTTTDPNPANRYKEPIQFAQRLTWGGEFIHAAPWSVGSQGRTNVSHGCVNMSTDNAKWLFSQTLVGSPLTIKGTPRTLQYGNGWTDWNKSWEEYVKGSAVPYQPPAPSASAAPSPSPSTGPS